jgi:hypothetical protein
MADSLSHSNSSSKEGFRRADILLLRMGLVVLAAGLVSFLGWRSSSRPLEKSVSQKTTEGIPRSPSSLPSPLPKPAPKTSGQLLTKAIDQLIKVDLNCGGRPNQKLFVTGGFVQLQGRTCLKSNSMESPQLKNLTNGYQGSFFRTGGGFYKTDLIQLSEGQNEIHFEFSDSIGKKINIPILVISHRI